MGALLQLIIIIATISVSSSTFISYTEWSKYKEDHNKAYYSYAAEISARFNYALNKERIKSHNYRYDRRRESYSLGVNQYSDLTFLQFAALFPKTRDIPSNGEFTVPSTSIQPSFSYAEQGLVGKIWDQLPTVCNSGWAYAAASVLEIFFAKANTTGSPIIELSAQNFIDCAGMRNACVNQVPQMAFDYLTNYSQSVYPESDYPNQPFLGQGMCILPENQANASTLTSYSNIANGDDAALKSIVYNKAPVVILFNPASFEFMHYKGGVFTQPKPTKAASNYMAVMGYGRDPVTAKDYWLIQNSFGDTWGEKGWIRIEINSLKPIANSAIYPSIR